jgi:hypothetical protein
MANHDYENSYHHIISAVRSIFNHYNQIVRINVPRLFSHSSFYTQKREKKNSIKRLLAQKKINQTTPFRVKDRKHTLPS